MCLAPAGCDQPARPKAATYSLAADARPTPWNTSHARGQKISTAHYDVYTTATRQQMLAIFPGFMEAAYQHYGELTGLREPASAHPMPVYMLGSRAEWADLTQTVVTENTDLYLNIQAGGYCYRGVCVFWDIGSLYTYSLAAHEGLHQYFSTRLKHRLPSWAEEGICTVTEGLELTADSVRFDESRNIPRFTALRETIVNGRWTPAAQLLALDAGDAIGSHPQAAGGYYAQLWAMVLFIRSDPQYSAGFRRMMADAEAGKLNEAFGMSQEDYLRVMATGRAYNKRVAKGLFEHFIARDGAAFEAGYSAFARRLAKLQ
jgi:hypothetical protein